MRHPGLVKGFGSLNPTSENPDVGHPVLVEERLKRLKEVLR